MAAKLQCEICGGKLVGKPGGIFECDSCGMEYDTAWAKAKIQENTGTVKVEGTVEVTGKVQIDGPVKVEGGANKESLLQRGKIALEDEQWNQAKSCFEQILSLDPSCAEAYLGIVMAQEHAGREELKRKYLMPGTQLTKDRNIKRARQFSPEIDAWFTELDKEIAKRIEEKIKRLREENKRKQEEEKQKQLLKAEQDKKDQERLALRKAALENAEKTLPHVRAQLASASGLIAASARNSVCLCANGSVVGAGTRRDGEKWGWYESPSLNAVAVASGAYTYLLMSEGIVRCTKHQSGDPSYQKEDRVETWRNIKAIAAASTHVLGLQKDGKVIAQGYNFFGQCDVEGWSDVIAIAAGETHSLGLRADGTVVSTKRKFLRRGMPDPTDVGEWRDIVAIAAGGSHSLGLLRNGTVISAGYSDNHSWTDWYNSVAIALGESHAVGLRADGSVIARGSNSNGECNVEDWQDIIAIAAGANHTLGLRRDGTVLATGKNTFGQCDVNGYKLFPSYEVLPELRILLQKKYALELEYLKINPGFFAGKKRKEIEAQIMPIDTRLKQLYQNG